MAVLSSAHARRVKSRRAQARQSRGRPCHANGDPRALGAKILRPLGRLVGMRRNRAGYSPRNLVGTRVVDSTSCFDAFTYLTIVGMCPLVSFSFPCISALVGSISLRMTDFHCA